MIDIKNYDFYKFNYNDFINDGYKFYDGIYGYKLYKKENDKLIILYINYNKDRINEIHIFTKLKNGINIDFYKLYKFIDNELKKELKHINKNIEIKENYKLPYDIFTKIYKKYVAYEYSLDRLFDIENKKLINDNYIDILNFLFDKYYIQNILEKIN